ncbi:hypothetical protein [Bacillus sp. AFS076308]|nr:hypothetical protein [Bacillus sp. AFS076308]
MKIGRYSWKTAGIWFKVGGKESFLLKMVTSTGEERVPYGVLFREVSGK